MITTVTALLTLRIPFPVLVAVFVLADLIIRTRRNVTGIQSAVEGGALELTVGQRGVGASLGDAVGAFGTGGKGTISPSAHHLDADFTWRTWDCTPTDQIRCRTACVVAC